MSDSESNLVNNPNACCIVIGGGHAAANLAPQVRAKGWQGKIIVVSAESLAPYHRPPLSKDYFAQCLDGDSQTRQQARERLYIRKPEFYEKKNIELRLDTRVTNINRALKVISLDSGETLAYDKLALATGAEPRRFELPGAELPGIFYMRGIADADAVIDAVSATRQSSGPSKAVIIGGGYIGLEAASSLRKVGVEVTILEAAERILQRVTGHVMSDFYRRVHTEEGVRIEEGIPGIAEFSGDDKVEAVVCSDGQRFDADLVLVGIGVIPCTELAEQCEIEIGNGIKVNELALTNDPDIVAAGDCANFFDAFYNTDLRLESVPHATSQAATAAATLCGSSEPYSFFPWFWSDQYDINLQIAGLSTGFDDIVIRGDLDKGRSACAFYFRGEQLIAMDAINRAKEFMLARKSIPTRPKVDKSSLQDESLELKSILGL